MSGKYVLGCINGFRPSESVIDYSSWLSKALNKELKLFHALDHQFHEGEADLSGSIGLGAREELLNELVEIEHEQNKLIQKKAKLILDDAKEKAMTNGVFRIDLCLRKGKLVDNLVELQDKLAVTVIGKFGKKHQDLNDGDVIGHKVEGLVRKLEKPILIVTEDFKEPESLCLAYDGSEGAAKALEFLVESEVAGNLSVHVVYVGEETDKTNAMLKSAKEKLEKASLSVETRILNGEIEDTLKEYLDLNEISILAMGAFGHNWFHDLLMGSLTSKMIRIIKRPLLVLR